MPTPVSRSEFESAGFDRWTWIDDGLEAEFPVSPFAAGGDLVARISRAADEANHHPDLTLRYPGIVGVRLTTHAVGGVTDLDIALAGQIERLVGPST